MVGGGSIETRRKGAVPVSVEQRVICFGMDERPACLTCNRVAVVRSTRVARQAPSRYGHAPLIARVGTAGDLSWLD